ncbi:hypothetical protein MICAC_1290005 [Microcystis aeruginosa PCC 9443]|uniref:Uncharacterized protein n=1 Tax=Microcystis aeruginosa PCC 9443 TaxID=1160281 RepID=I4FYT8_MICAE|nr:hypothetical protein MICAC_1290005 [Microcystis aeruginosa PCC 9443]
MTSVLPTQLYTVKSTWAVIVPNRLAPAILLTLSPLHKLTHP